MPDVLSVVGTVTTGPGAGNMGNVATQTYDLLIRQPLRSRLWFGKSVV